MFKQSKYGSSWRFRESPESKELKRSKNTKKLPVDRLVFKGVSRNFHWLNFLFEPFNPLLASQNKENIIFSMKIEAFLRSRKRIGRFQSYDFKENSRIVHFSEHLEIVSRVQETETTQNEKHNVFYKHWKVSDQALRRVTILVREVVPRRRNSVVETWFSKMIFCSSGRTSAFS